MDSSDADVIQAPSPVKKKSQKRKFMRIHVDKSLLFTSTKIKYDTRETIWSEENLSKLSEYMKKNGFHGEYEEIRKMFPRNLISENSLREMFNELSRWSEPTKDDTEENSATKKRIVIKPSPIEEWISMIKDCIVAQRHANIPSLMLKWIAMFEEHPDPASSCDVDYKAIYTYISSLADGHIPKQLNPQSALKLVTLFDELVKIIKASATESRELIVKSAKLSIFNQKILRDEKNKLLRNRRRAEWSEEEKQQAAVIKADNLDEIKKMYCENRGLNPFSFPPACPFIVRDKVPGMDCLFQCQSETIVRLFSNRLLDATLKSKGSESHPQLGTSITWAIGGSYQHFGRKRLLSDDTSLAMVGFTWPTKDESTLDTEKKLTSQCQQNRNRSETEDDPSSESIERHEEKVTSVPLRMVLFPTEDELCLSQITPSSSMRSFNLNPTASNRRSLGDFENSMTNVEPDEMMQQRRSDARRRDEDPQWSNRHSKVSFDVSQQSLPSPPNSPEFEEKPLSGESDV